MKRVVVFVLFALVFASGSVFASQVKVSKETVKQGGFFEIRIDDSYPNDVFIITFQERKYRSARSESARSHRAIIPVNVFDKTGETEIKIESKHEVVVPQKIIVEKSNFGESKKIQIIRPLSSKEFKKYKKERKILDEIYHQTIENPFFVTIDEPSFAYPLEHGTEISSPFGFLRQRKIGAQSKKIEIVPHGGTDLVVPNGSVVFAAENGVVRLARELINSGNTIIIDHGYNVFSVYMHLSKMLVKEEDWVWKRGEIARSGDTGRVTGAHLHIGIRIWDTWVDPKYFIVGLGGEK